MKYLFFALSSFFFANVNSQCIVDAGDDIHFCLNNTYSLDSIILSPNLVNVQLPLTSISWNYKYQIPNTNIVESSSDLLNDTSILNPFFVQRSFLNEIFLNITIIDDLNNVCSDSIKISYSLFSFFPDDFTIINEGDTAQIYAIAESGFPPYSYIWYPNNNISDTSIGSPTVWPNQSQQYQATVTDSMECSLNMPPWNIQVLPNNIVNFTDDKLSIYPNPTNDVLNISFETKIENIIIILSNSIGQIVLNQEIINNQLDLSHLSKGVYHFQVLSKDKLISEGNIIKE